MKIKTKRSLYRNEHLVIAFWFLEMKVLILGLALAALQVQAASQEVAPVANYADANDVKGVTFPIPLAVGRKVGSLGVDG